MATIFDLYADIINAIFGQLDPTSLVNLGRSCKTMKSQIDTYLERKFSEIILKTELSWEAISNDPHILLYIPKLKERYRCIEYPSMSLATVRQRILALYVYFRITRQSTIFSLKCYVINMTGLWLIDPLHLRILLEMITDKPFDLSTTHKSMYRTLLESFYHRPEHRSILLQPRYKFLYREPLTLFLLSEANCEG